MKKNNAGEENLHDLPDFIEVLLECAYDNALRKQVEGYGKVLEYYPSLGYLLMQIPSGQMAALQQVEGIRAVHESRGISACMNQARGMIHAEGKKETENLTGKSIGIAFLDTGISPVADFIYPQNRIAAYRDFVYGRKKIYDDNGHGTQERRGLASHQRGCPAKIIQNAACPAKNFKK